MNITLQQSKLSRALSYVSRSVNGKHNIPVLTNILLVVERGMLKISGTNLDMGINMWIAGTVETEGSVTANAKILSDLINECGEGKITLKLDGNSLMIKSETTSAELQTISATEFPVLPKVTGTPVLSLQPNALIDSLGKVTFACSVDNTPGKSQQTGVYFELPADKAELTLVGLDGYRLSQKRLKVKRALEQELTAIIPAKPLEELAKILQSEEEAEEVEIYVNPTRSQAVFKFNEIEFSIRMLEGPYPDYKKVLPVDHDFSCEVDKGEFDRAIRIINTMARNVLGNRTNFDLDPDKGTVTLSSMVVDLGKNETVVKATNSTGDLLQSSYNLRYLAEMVSSIGSPRITFQTKSALSAAIFLDQEDKDYLHLIMPLRREG